MAFFLFHDTAHIKWSGTVEAESQRQPDTKELGNLWKAFCCLPDCIWNPASAMRGHLLHIVLLG